MNTAILQQPFFQVTVPIILAMATSAVWALISTNRRLDDIRAELEEFRGDVNTRFVRGETPPRSDR